jgi:hypothetical protein
MSEFSDEVERRLDPLYRERPEEFVAQRNELARELREEGERDQAQQVKALRRPSAAAWLINRIAADDPDRARSLARAGEELAQAQQRVLAGEQEGGVLRTAAHAEREQIEGFVGEARRVGAADGGVNETVIERVAQTLRAVGGDSDLRDRVLRGRLEKEQTSATVGLPATGRAARPKAAKTKAREVERARRELARLREELAAAVVQRDQNAAAVDQAESDLRRARTELKGSSKAVRELERKVERAERGGR